MLSLKLLGLKKISLKILAIFVASPFWPDGATHFLYCPTLKVTATHAIMVGRGQQKTPAAVAKSPAAGTFDRLTDPRWHEKENPLYHCSTLMGNFLDGSGGSGENQLAEYVKGEKSHLNNSGFCHYS